MANTLGIDITNRIVTLRPDAHVEEYREPQHLRFYATSGFGCKPYTDGTAVFGYYLCDGEYARISGDSIGGIEDGEPTMEERDRFRKP